MPVNPYEEEQFRRNAQIGAMRGSEPTNGTLPIGVRDPVMDLTGGRNGGFVNPAAAPPVPQRQTPSAGSTVPLRNEPPPPGWDAGNWADPNMRSVKYDAGRLLYGARRPSEVGTRVQSPEFQSRFPGATFDGKDRVNFAGALSDGDRGTPVNWIDVLLAADRDADSSNGIAWMPIEEGATPETGGAPAAGGIGGLNPALDNSSLARIMAELTATANDEQSPAAREAILALLNGGI